MLRLLMVLYAVVILVLLALDVAIHADQFRWAASAVAAYMATALPMPDVTVPTWRPWRNTSA